MWPAQQATMSPRILPALLGTYSITPAYPEFRWAPTCQAYAGFTATHCRPLLDQRHRP